MATVIFLLINLIVLGGVFIFARVGAVSWELILKKKHSNEIENFMVVLALFYAAAYGGSIEYSFDNLQLSTNPLHLILTYIFFIFMNIVILISTSIFFTYLVSAFRKSVTILIGVFLLINLALLSHEVVSFDKSYNKKQNLNTDLLTHEVTTVHKTYYTTQENNKTK